MSTNLVRVGPTPAPPWASSSRLAELDRKEGENFTEAEYARRMKRVTEEMEAHKVDALLVFRPSSVEYVCGFHNVAEPIPIPVLLTQGRTVLSLLEFEAGNAVVSSNADKVLFHSRAEDGLELLLEELVAAVGPGARVGLEFGFPWVPPQVVLSLQSKGFEIVDAPIVELVRLVLSEEEIACMRTAATITGRGIEAAKRAAADPGATDSSIAAEIRYELTKDADSLTGLDVIVAAGWSGGIAHSNWGNRPIDRSLPVVLEFSGAHHRYSAPVMRTLSYGELTGEAKRLNELATLSEELLLSELKVGRRCSDVARAVTAGLGEVDDWVLFHYVYGYPIGLSHPPTWMDGYSFYLSEQNDGIIEENMAFHCPASFRSWGKMGICFSNTLLMTADGPEVLTPQPSGVIHV